MRDESPIGLRKTYWLGANWNSCIAGWSRYQLHCASRRAGNVGGRPGTKTCATSQSSWCVNLRPNIFHPRMEWNGFHSMPWNFFTTYLNRFLIAQSGDFAAGSVHAAFGITMVRVALHPISSTFRLACRLRLVLCCFSTCCFDTCCVRCVSPGIA